ncbi:hypothetical protein K2173_004313 [Erythroxylum novogranatense]|uniref:Small ribosomal subunit protein uS17c n=1 Tax=Erythroxylum novogranatense TaxID=1862640 RepID=A0AAV8U5B0_9ROSI|nr:hypothetical protein K2173_004313 [Erythroxylum novogranatense]
MVLPASLTLTFNSLTLSIPFPHGSTPRTHLSKLNCPFPLQLPKSSTVLSPIRAMKSMQGKVVFSTNDKTVAVEVTRLAPHPKYKRRVRKKKKYQAHDPDNQFKVGDFVQLQKGRPISKTKTFLAVSVPVKSEEEKNGEDGDGADKELGIPSQSRQELQG